MSDLQNIIEEAFEHRADINPRSVDTHVKEAVLEALNLLDSGERRVAESQSQPGGYSAGGAGRNGYGTSARFRIQVRGRVTHPISE